MQSQSISAPIGGYAPLPKTGETYNGLSRARLYKLAGLGKIRLIKDGRRTFIDGRSVVTYLDALPTASIAAPRAAPRAAQMA